MKRAGFTMIELIFVIVILGILAAVAIPKLAASREDAVATALLSDYKSVLKTATTSMLATDAEPNFETLFGTGRHGGIVVADSNTLTISKENGSGTCAQIDANATHITVSAISTDDDCNRFDSAVAESINVLGQAVVK